MKKIIAIIRPFDYQQNLFVYEDGIKIDAKQTTINELGETLFALIEIHNVEKIDFTGPKKYLEGLTRDTKERINTKYNYEKNIEINII